jgi:hypothetical protein
LVLIPQLLWRDIERRWTAIDTPGAPPASEATAALERKILDYPLVVATVLLITSLIGYALGALQIRWFAELPVAEAIKVCLLGVVTGWSARSSRTSTSNGASPRCCGTCLRRRVGADDGRRVPLSAKVFAARSSSP